MRYRMLKPEDIEAVFRLGEPDFGSRTEYSWDWSRGHLGKYLERQFGSGIVVCVEGAAVIGFVLMQNEYSHQRPGVSWLTYVFVDERHRRRGIGSRLLELALAKMEERGKQELGIDVYAGNRASLRFFERRGFALKERWVTLARQAPRGQRRRFAKTS